MTESLHVCVLGIDGSGKSTLSAALPIVCAAEMEIVAGAAGEDFRIAAPAEDHLCAGFHPGGLPLAARFSRWAKRKAKQYVDNRRVYPLFKLAQMLCQDAAARALSRRHGVDLMVSDGNTLLSAMGRAANYRRPASDHVAAGEAPSSADLAAVFSYLLDGESLPEESATRLPPLHNAKRIQRACRLLGLDGAWLPDVVLFLDLSPEAALQRIAARRQKVDRHENADDLAQAREMYLKTLEAFERYRGPGRVHRICVDAATPGQSLRAAIQAIAPQVAAARAGAAARGPLGTTSTRLAGASLWSKVFNARYLFGYLVPRWFDDAWREPLFPFSPSGRLFLREGYSAGVMRAIYEQDQRRASRATPSRSRSAGPGRRSGYTRGWLERVFLDYPLHRAVYDRLQILTRHITREFEERLQSGHRVCIFTAPSGFAYDLFRPLEAIAGRSPELPRGVEMIAADLDPHQVLAGELEARAAKLGIAFTFLRGDITSAEMQARFAERAPYDLALFVGLSAWLPKPQTVRHLKWLAANLAPRGAFVTDCFTARAYALSGRYAGFRANYYSPGEYRALLDYCGFDGLGALVESGRDAVNHVLIARRLSDCVSA